MRIVGSFEAFKEFVSNSQTLSHLPWCYQVRQDGKVDRILIDSVEWVLRNDDQVPATYLIGFAAAAILVDSWIL